MVLLSGLALSLLSLIPVAYSCSGHEHQHHQRLVPSSPLTPPSRPLQWGDINIIHTTDTHGWLLGHQKHSFPEPNYRCALISVILRVVFITNSRASGDFGDFFSFVAHMKKIAQVSLASLSLLELFNAF
jgi:2',3'-cyclic-nucleotide 2'-phosphodiesterase (5'-nucleotidase family)